MQQLVDILEDYLKRNFNEDTLKVFRQLWGKSNVSEFDIAEHLRLSINYVRNLLYGLHAFNLVNSTRKKDRQKGWYIYYWTFNLKHALRLIIAEKEQQFAMLQKSREEGGRERYVCPDKHIAFNAVRALEHEFKCPECEKLLVRQMTQVDPVTLQARMEQLGKDIEYLQQPSLLEMPKEKVGKPVKKPAKKAAKKPRRKIKKIAKKIRKLQKKLTKVKKPKVQKKILKKIRKLKVRKKLLKQGKQLPKHLPPAAKRVNPQQKVQASRAKLVVKKQVAGAQKSGLLSKLRKRVGF